MAQKYTNRSICFDPAIVKELDAIAERTGLSRSGVVSQIIAEYLAMEGTTVKVTKKTYQLRQPLRKK